MQVEVEKLVDVDLAEFFPERIDSQPDSTRSFVIHAADALSSQNIVSPSTVTLSLQNIVSPRTVTLPSENVVLAECVDLSALNIEFPDSAAFSSRDIVLRDSVDFPSRDIVLPDSVDSPSRDIVLPDSVDFSPSKDGALVYISSDGDSPAGDIVCRLMKLNISCADEGSPNVLDSGDARKKNIPAVEGNDIRSSVKKKVARKKKKTSSTCKGPYIPPVSSDFSASQRKALLAYIRVLRHRSRNTRVDYAANLRMSPTHCECNVEFPPFALSP